MYYTLGQESLIGVKNYQNVIFLLKLKFNDFFLSRYFQLKILIFGAKIQISDLHNFSTKIQISVLRRIHQNRIFEQNSHFCPSVYLWSPTNQTLTFIFSTICSWHAPVKIWNLQLHWTSKCPIMCSKGVPILEWFTFNIVVNCMSDWISEEWILLIFLFTSDLYRNFILVRTEF